jgi:hypothetical protein
MKMLVFATALALASIGSVPATAMPAQSATQSPAQSQDSIVIADQVEYTVYTSANNQTDPKARAAALESFLKTFPNSIAKKSVLGVLVDLYQNPFDSEKELSAAQRLFDLDPANLKAAYYVVALERVRGTDTKAPDAKAIAAAADTATKALAIAKPSGVSDDDWKKQTDAAYPMFYSAEALDAEMRSDFKLAVDDFNAELKYYSPEASKSGPALADTLRLARSYASSTPPDEVKAIWFYSRALDYAPAPYKADIELQLKYWYNKYHGDLGGLDDLKKVAAESLFPPDSFAIQRAPTLAERISKFADTDPDQLSLADKETILAHAFKADAERVWAKLKDQTTPVPGTVISADASAIHVTITQQGATPKLFKTTSYLVKLKTPVSCSSAVVPNSEIKTQEDFILDNGFKEETDQLALIFKQSAGKIRKIVLDPTVSTIKVAVTEDAKATKAPDFIVNLKAPMACKAAPLTGSEFGMQPASELVGTYDAYTRVASADVENEWVQIVLRDGYVQPGKKKATVHKSISAAHKALHS